MTLSLIKAAVAATAITVVSASGAFAFAPLSGEFNYDTAIKADHFFGAPTINWASARWLGEEVGRQSRLLPHPVPDPLAVAGPGLLLGPLRLRLRQLITRPIR